ncbi:MAG TPA: hypothetical protein VL918_09960 [Sphingobium sp.]|nr:hypothetical protein [Sphingobium sp.]
MRLAGLFSLAVLAGCVPQPKMPVRLTTATPPPAPPPPAQAPDWQDWPVTLGNWSYARDAGGTTARYAGLWLRCDLASRTVTLGRNGVVATPDGSAMMTLRTSEGVLQWPARRASGERSATAAARSAGDVGLDWIAFSRGRFAVELPGSPPIVAPNWAEPVRVIEDCRG